MKQAIFIVSFLSLVFQGGCEISDDDRCVDGMYWDDVYKACIVEATTADTDSTTDGDTDTAFGAPCTSAANCPSPPADYCLLDVTQPQNPGMCTIDDCSSGGCPTGNLCCNCLAVNIIPFPSPLCIPAANTGQLTGFGCTCD